MLRPRLGTEGCEAEEVRGRVCFLMNQTIFGIRWLNHDSRSLTFHIVSSEPASTDRHCTREQPHPRQFRVPVSFPMKTVVHGLAWFIQKEVSLAVESVCLAEPVKEVLCRGQIPCLPATKHFPSNTSPLPSSDVIDRSTRTVMPASIFPSPTAAPAPRRSSSPSQRPPRSTPSTADPSTRHHCSSPSR